MYDFKGKRVLITAGAGGLGTAFVETLLKLGIEKIAIVDINDAVGKELADKFTSEYGGDRTYFYKCDVADGQELEDVFGKVVEDFGGLDIVLNNAGIYAPLDIDNSINVSFTSIVRVADLAFRYMGKDQGKSGGVLVNTASILGLDAAAGGVIYTACKHGIIGLTKAYGMKYHWDRSNIRVMAICPGVTLTALITASTRKDTIHYLTQEFSRELRSLPKQKPDVVAKTLVEMINYGENGCFWVIEDGESYEIEFPSRTELKKIIF